MDGPRGRNPREKRRRPPSRTLRFETCEDRRLLYGGVAPDWAGDVAEVASHSPAGDPQAAPLQNASSSAASPAFHGGPQARFDEKIPKDASPKQSSGFDSILEAREDGAAVVGLPEGIASDDFGSEADDFGDADDLLQGKDDLLDDQDVLDEQDLSGDIEYLDDVDHVEADGDLNDGEESPLTPEAPADDEELATDSGAETFLAPSRGRGSSPGALVAGLFISPAARGEIDLGAATVKKRKSKVDHGPSAKNASEASATKELVVRGKGLAKNAVDATQRGAGLSRTGAARRELLAVSEKSEPDRPEANSAPAAEHGASAPEPTPSKGEDKQSSGKPAANTASEDPGSPSSPDAAAIPIPAPIANVTPAKEGELHGEGEAPPLESTLPVPRPVITAAPPVAVSGPPPTSQTVAAAPPITIVVTAPAAAPPAPPVNSAPPVTIAPPANSSPPAVKSGSAAPPITIDVKAAPPARSAPAASPPVASPIKSAPPITIVPPASSSPPVVKESAAAPPPTLVIPKPAAPKPAAPIPVVSPPPAKSPSAAPKQAPAAIREPAAVSQERPASTAAARVNYPVVIVVTFQAPATPISTVTRTSTRPARAAVVTPPSIAPEGAGSREADRAPEAAPEGDQGQVLSRAVPVEAPAPAPAATTPDATALARGDVATAQTVCEALPPDLAPADAEESSSDASAQENTPAASPAAAPSDPVGPQPFYRAELAAAAAVIASSGLEAIDQAVTELVDELNDMGEEFADLLSTGRASPMTAAVAGLAIAGVVELRFRRKRPAPNKQGDWIWLFSDLLGDAPGDGS